MQARALVQGLEPPQVQEPQLELGREQTQGRQVLQFLHRNRGLHQPESNNPSASTGRMDHGR